MGFVRQLVFSLWSLLLRYPFIQWKNKPRKKPIEGSTEGILNILRKGPVMHRGGVPENTIKAFRESKSVGATSVEVDLQFTKDGHPVLLHDDTVDRTSNGKGAISDMTLEEVKSLDFGVKFGYEGVCIPTLNEAIQTLKELDMYLFLEVKTLNNNALRIILELFKNDHTNYDRIIVISFFPDVIYSISKIDPRIKVGYITRSTLFSQNADGRLRFHNHQYFTRILQILERVMYWVIKRYIFTVLQLLVMLPHKDDVLHKKFDLDKYRSAGVVVLTWTVNDDSERQHLHDVLNVHYMTDNRSAF